MIVRIRLSLDTSRHHKPFVRRQAALIVSSLMTPIALAGWTLGGWSVAASMNWSGDFPISEGLFSHWQVWVALAIAVQFVAFLLQRYASGDKVTGR
jgi:hypothetical protein